MSARNSWAVLGTEGWAVWSHTFPPNPISLWVAKHNKQKCCVNPPFSSISAAGKPRGYLTPQKPGYLNIYLWTHWIFRSYQLPKRTAQKRAVALQNSKHIWNSSYWIPYGFIAAWASSAQDYKYTHTIFSHVRLWIWLWQKSRAKGPLKNSPQPPEKD